MTPTITTCRDCTKALQVWNWAVFNGDCPECQVRAIATSPPEIQTGAFDQVHQQCGPKGLERVRELVRLEHARILKLKGRTP